MQIKCLIFGGGGFIGSHICDGLLNNNYNVTIFDKQNFNRKNIEHNIGKVKIIEGDFNNEIDLHDSITDIDVIFHLISSTLPSTSNDNPVYDVETNLISTLKLLEITRKSKVKKIIFISSGGTVYGIPQKNLIKENHPLNPICSYGIVKKTIEDYLRMYNYLYGIDYYIFRLSNPFGERQNPFISQGAVAVFIWKIMNNKKIEIWGDGSTVRDYIYIKDVVRPIVKSLELNQNRYRVFNIGSGVGYTLNYLIKTIETTVKKKAIIEYKDTRNIDVPYNVLDNSLSKKIFKWSPRIPFKTAIKYTYNYFNSIFEENEQ